MTIRFNCARCHKEVKAPEEAGGKRGKCPFCGISNYIPLPVSEDEILPLAPLDEEEEKRRQREVEELLRQERELFAEAQKSQPPPGQKDSADSQDVSHFVVNYCLDMFSGNLRRAEINVESLMKIGQPGLQAVADFLNGKFREDALKTIPPRVLQGFLLQLRDHIKKN